MSYNKVILIGFVGNDPKVTRYEDGSVKASFSVATTDRGYTTSDGREVPAVTTWHNVSASGKLAEWVEKYVKKGSAVTVDGKYLSRDYVNQNKVKVENGLPTRTYATDTYHYVQASKVDFFSLGSGLKKKEDGETVSGNAQNNTPQQVPQQSPQPIGAQSDLPF